MIKILLIALMITFTFANVGKVAVVKGDATVERDVKRIKAYNEMGLLRKDTVTTQQGRMQMHFNDNTVISLGRESRFVIKEYLYSESSKKGSAIFKIEKGFVKTITGAIGKLMPESFVLETATTKITPHGTIWSVAVSDKDEIYRVLEGSVSLVFNDGVERKIELNAGERVTLKKSVDGVVKSFRKSKIRKIQASTEYENSLETNGAIIREDQDMNSGSIVNENNGHGNDPGNNPSNPGG